MLTSGSILLKAHISEDKFQNTYIQSGPPKVSYLSPLTASFWAPLACLSRTLHFYGCKEIWSEIIVKAARGGKKLTAI